MNKFLSANKSKIVWIVIAAIAILLITLLAIMLFLYLTPPLPTVADKVPSAVLQIQGMEQKAKLTGFCWEDGGCGDFGAFNTPRKALSINSPFVATLGFSIDTPPNGVSIRVYDASRLKESTTWTNSWRSWDFNSFKGSLVLEKELAPKKEQIFSLELKSGLYVISVSAEWERGGAGYGFLVEVSDCVSIFCFR